MDDFNFKRRNLLSGPHLLGVLFIIAGLFALTSPTFLTSESSWEKTVLVGVGAIVTGLLIVSSYGGTRIDVAKKRVKEYYSVGGYLFGKWAPLPTIATVRVIAASYRSRNTPNGISPTLSRKITDFKVLLYSTDSTLVLSFVYSNQDRAIRQASYLATTLRAALKTDLLYKSASTDL